MKCVITVTATADVDRTTIDCPNGLLDRKLIPLLNDPPVSVTMSELNQTQ